MQNPVRSIWVQLPGRIAREDVDAGDARRARAMDGPSQSHPLRKMKLLRAGGFGFEWYSCINAELTQLGTSIGIV